MTVDLRNLGSASSQWLSGWDTYSGFITAYGAASAVNTASDQTLAVTVQWTVASANDSWKRIHAQALLGQN